MICFTISVQAVAAVCELLVWLSNPRDGGQLDFGRQQRRGGQEEGTARERGGKSRIEGKGKQVWEKLDYWVERGGGTGYSLPKLIFLALLLLAVAGAVIGEIQRQHWLTGQE